MRIVESNKTWKGKLIIPSTKSEEFYLNDSNYRHPHSTLNIVMLKYETDFKLIYAPKMTIDEKYKGDDSFTFLMVDKKAEEKNLSKIVKELEAYSSIAIEESNC